MNIFKEKNSKLIKKLIIACLCVLGIAVLSAAAYQAVKVISIVKNNGFLYLLSMYGNKAGFIYFMISFLQPIALPVPEPVTIMAGSSVLGAFKGATLGFMGSVCGIIIMYLFVRFTGAKFIEMFVSKKQIDKFDQYIKKHELLVILLLFILPVLPDEAICVGAGLTKINAVKFIFVAVVSKLITAFSLSYSVSFIKLNLSTGIIIASVVLMIKWLIDSKKKKST